MVSHHILGAAVIGAFHELIWVADVQEMPEKHCAPPQRVPYARAVTATPLLRLWMRRDGS
jgi:hypothetical protein